MEKVLSLDSEMGGDLVGTKLPYVGPRTFQQFLECFCVIFKRKSSEAAVEKDNLRYFIMDLERKGSVECTIKQGNKFIDLEPGRREGKRKGEKREGGREEGRERGREG